MLNPKTFNEFLGTMIEAPGEGRVLISAQLEPEAAQILTQPMKSSVDWRQPLFDVTRHAGFRLFQRHPAKFIRLARGVVIALIRTTIKIVLQ